MNVTTDGFVFHDGLETAAFHVTNACLEADGLVTVLQRFCTTEEDPYTAGTLGLARLGLDVIRRVDAGEEDHPLFEASTAQAGEQTTVIHLELHQAGDVRVEVAAHATDEVDPTVVPTSASAGGQEDHRSVKWELPGATPGTYSFSVRFAPGASEDFTGQFVPQVTVDREDNAAILLEHGAGSVSADGTADRKSTIIMNQRVTPAVGEPTLFAEGYLAGYDPTGASEAPEVFAARAGINARGNYHAPTMGTVAANASLHLAELGPSAEGTISAAVRTSPRPTQPAVANAMTKEQVDQSTIWGEDWTILGFQYKLATAVPGEGSTFSPYGPLAGTLYDEDHLSRGLTLAIGSTTGELEGLPSNSAGSLHADWDGQVALSGSGAWVAPLPATEPNADQRVYQDARLTLGLSPARYAVAYAASVALPMVVTGGDIDNRYDGTPVQGEPVVVQLPEHWEVSGAGMITFGQRDAPTEYAYDLSMNRSTGVVTVTPWIGSGGYWLESTNDGYDREWSPHLHMLTIGARDTRMQPAVGDIVLEQTVDLTPGEQALVEIFDAAGEKVAEQRLDEPGTWHLLYDGEKLRQSGSILSHG